MRCVCVEGGCVGREKWKLAGDWPLAMSGTVDPLGEEVPFSLGLRAEAPLALPGEAVTYGNLQEARATLAGNLLGISAELQVSTGSQWIGANRLQAMLRWAPKTGVELQRASLQGELGMVEATGTLGLGAALPFQLALQLRDACLPRWAQTPGCRVGGTVRTEGTLAENATTLTAVLSSLQMGFRTLAIQKQSSEVWKVLGAVKTDFGKFKEVLDKVKAQLETAAGSIEKAQDRTRLIGNKLQKVQELPANEAQQVLGLPTIAENGEADA